MGLRYVESKDAPRGTGPYSPAIVAGSFVFVSGQGPLDPETHEVLGATIEEQTKHTLDNVRALIEEAGTSLDRVVRVTAYLANTDDYEGYNRAYSEYFPRNPPTRTTVGGDLFGILIEVDCIAYIEAQLSS